MLIAGLTGAIGSGKSLVADFFSELGAYVIHADLVARTIADTDVMAREKIRQEFGAAFFSQDGILDRRALGRLVFANPESRQKLNAILHPRTIAVIDEQIQACRDRGTWPLVIVEAALIFEAGLEKKYRPIIVVDAPREMLIRRVQQRDGLSEEEIMDRLSAQIDPKEKVNRADFVIINDQSTGYLKKKVKRLYQQLLKFKPTVT